MNPSPRKPVFKKDSFLDKIRYQSCLDEADCFTPGNQKVTEEFKLSEESQKRDSELRGYRNCISESQNYVQ